MALSDIAPFLWGPGGSRLTPEEIASQRKYAQSLLASGSDYSPVASPWQGAARVAQALFGGMMGHDAGEASKANAVESASLVQALLGGSSAPVVAPTAAPAAGPAVGSPASMAAVPDNIAQIIAQNVPPELQGYATNLIGKESSFRPDAVSPTGATGLAQFTRGTGKQYGLVTPEGDLRADPVKNVQALVALTNDNRQALTQALGRPPTDGELALAHQQGAQGAISLLSGQSVPSQNLAVNGVAPGTDPRAAAQKIMAYYGGGGGALPALPSGDGAMNAADRAGLLSGKTSPVLAFNGNPQDLMSPDRAYSGPVPTDMNDAARQGLLSGMTTPQVATQQPMPGSFEEAPGVASQPVPAPSQQIAQALVVPQAAPAAASPPAAAAPQASATQGAPAGLNPAIVKAMSSPYVSDQVRKIGTMLFENNLAQQQKANDPLRKLQIMEAQGKVDSMPIELQGKRLANQKLERELQGEGAQPLSAQERASYGIPAEQPAYKTRSGEIKFGPAGTRINIDQKGEGEFSKTIGANQAKMFTGMVEDGIAAKTDLANIGVLRSQMARLPGGFVGGMQALANSYGIKVGPQASAVEIVSSLVDKLTPQQRQGMPGAASDRDVAMFKNALPKLNNTPDGNAMILDTMEGLAKYRQQQADIAARVTTGDLSRTDGIKALSQLPDPFEKFRASLYPAGAPKTGDVIKGFRFKGGDPADKNSWERAQ